MAAVKNDRSLRRLKLIRGVCDLPQLHIGICARGLLDITAIRLAGQQCILPVQTGSRWFATNRLFGA